MDSILVKLSLWRHLFKQSHKGRDRDRGRDRDKDKDKDKDRDKTNNNNMVNIICCDICMPREGATVNFHCIFRVLNLCKIILKINYLKTYKLYPPPYLKIPNSVKIEKRIYVILGGQTK